MHAAKWLGLGAAGYLWFLLATFPAGTAYGLLPRSAAIPVRGFSGTLWSGQASVGQVAGIGLHDIRWELSPWGLLLGQLRGSVEARLEDGFVSTRVRASLRTLSFSELRASSGLASLSAPLVQVTGGMAGQVGLSLATLELREGVITDAVGDIRIQDFAVPPLLGGRGQGLIALGNYTVQLLPTDGAGLSARFEDAGGPLEVTGTLILDLERRYRLEGLLQPRDGAAPELIQGLQLMAGDPDRSGHHRLMLTGSL